MSKLETNTIDTISGTNTLQVGDGNVATINLGKSGDTINVPSGVTIANSGTATGFGANTPAFNVWKASNQTISSETLTKVTFSDEEFDTNNNFASSRFTPTVAGYYQINASLDMTNAATNVEDVSVHIYKNGHM